MLRPKSKTAFLAAGLLAAAGFIIWPGCATPPLPASRQPISSIRRSDFSFKKNNLPSRDQLIAKIGEPDANFQKIKVVCYRVNYISRHRLWLLFGIIPIAAPKDPELIEIALVQFDDHNHVLRIKTKITYDNVHTWRHVAWEWLGIQEPEFKPVNPNHWQSGNTN